MFIVFFFWEHHGMAVGISTTKNVFSFFFFKGCVCVMTQWGLIGFYDDDDDDGDDDVLIYTYVIL